MQRALDAAAEIPCRWFWADASWAVCLLLDVIISFPYPAGPDQWDMPVVLHGLEAEPILESDVVGLAPIAATAEMVQT